MQFVPDNRFQGYGSNKMNHSFSFFESLLWLILFSLPIFAEQLPLKIYTSADGLANDVVNKIVADSRGFLWFCTDDGLSRFDGYKFKNYTQEDGLPHRSITDFLETKGGTYLVATPRGLAVFNPNGKAFRWNIIEGKLEQNSNRPLAKLNFDSLEFKVVDACNQIKS